jgi:hypothetical protein
MKAAGYVIAALFVLLIVAGLILLSVRSRADRRSQAQTLSDGTVLQIEAVTFGQTHRFETGRAWQRWLQQHAPFLAKVFIRKPTMAMSSTSSTQHETAMIWLNRHDPVTGRYLAPDWDRFEVIDDHGCRFHIGGWGSSYAGGPQNFNVSHVSAEVFPRRQSHFRFLAKTHDGEEAECQIVNPAPSLVASNWTPEPLPITRADGDVEITLRRIQLLQGTESPWPRTDFEVTQNGIPTREWDDRQVRFIDPMGNTSWNLLCTNEPAWKVSVQLYRTAEAKFAEEEIWRLPKVRVPKAGEGLTMRRETNLNGVALSVAAFAGTGTHVVSNGIFIRSNPIVAGSTWSTSSGSENGVPYEITTTARKTPFLWVRVSGLKQNERVLVRAREEAGTVFAADNTGSSGNLHLFAFKQPIEVDEVDLELIVNKPRTAEFIVQPPMVSTRR